MGGIKSHLSRSSISPFFDFSLKLSTFPAPSNFYCVKNMHYSRSRFAGGKVDEQTRHSASPLLGLNYLFRRSLIQLDRSAIQYSSVYNHIYNCPLDSLYVMYGELIICTRVTCTNLEHNCRSTMKEFRGEFGDCTRVQLSIESTASTALCVSHPAIQHAVDADDHAEAAWMHECRSC